MKLIGRVFRYLLGLVLLVLLLDVLSYVGVPVYRFAPGSSFAGDSIYNPYRGVDPANWRKANFHAHQRERKYEAYTTDQFFDAYRKQHYDIIGLSDHCYLNYAQSDRAGFIPTYEFGWGTQQGPFPDDGGLVCVVAGFPVDVDSFAVAAYVASLAFTGPVGGAQSPRTTACGRSSGL